MSFSRHRNVMYQYQHSIPFYWHRGPDISEMIHKLEIFCIHMRSCHVKAWPSNSKDYKLPLKPRSVLVHKFVGNMIVFFVFRVLQKPNLFAFIYFWMLQKISYLTDIIRWRIQSCRCVATLIPRPNVQGVFGSSNSSWYVPVMNTFAICKCMLWAITSHTWYVP